MEYERIIRFQYYQLKCRIYDQKKKKWSKYQLFNLVDWLMKVKNEDLLKKFIDFGNTKAMVEQYTYNKENDIWGVRFMKLRDTNIPSKVKENQSAEVIPLADDEYIGEDVTIIFEKSSGIAMIQSNRFSLNISRLEEFFQYINNSNNVEISIQPIIMGLDSDKLLKEYYKTLDLSFANISEWSSRGRGKKRLKDIITPMKELGGYVGHITVGIGHYKDETLNRAEIQELVGEIQSNKRFIRSARLKVKEDDDTDVEIVDLFEDIYHDFITFSIESRKSLDYKVAVTSMIYYFKKRRKQLYKAVSYSSE